ncbi:hypothetical protein BH23ACT4_BH23ACT4_15790 [soil metagenome]
MAWVEEFSSRTIRLIGVAENLGALGLIIPALTGIAPLLTPIAALGLAVVQVLAARLHLHRGETQMLPINLVLALLAVVVVWGRFGPEPF